MTSNKRPASSKKATNDSEMIKSMHSLEKAIRVLPEQYGYMLHPWKSVGVHFVRGIAYGIGIIVSFAIVIPFIVSILRHVEWIPIIGTFLEQLNNWMESARPLTQFGSLT